METEQSSNDIFGQLFLTLTQAISQNRSLDEFGLTRLQAITLRNVYRQSGITMTQLAQKIGITRPQLTRIIDTLEERGLVSRHHNDDNHRVINVLRTEKGKKVVKKHMDLIQSRIQKLVDTLDDEDQKALVTHLQETIRLMEKAGIVELGVEKN